MKNCIHSTAILEKGVELGSNNIIKENVIIRNGVRVGNGNIFEANTHIANNVNIGNNNKFSSFISIGSMAEMGSKKEIYDKDSKISIGNNNKFREFITINLPARKKITLIKNNNYFMARTHIPHDAEIGSNIVFATNSLVGGGCCISDYAYIGLNAHVHQWINIGEGAMLGMNSATITNVPPFMTVVGVPSKVIKINLEGLKRRKIDSQEICSFKKYLQGFSNKNSKKTNYLIDTYIQFISSNSMFLKI